MFIRPSNLAKPITQTQKPLPPHTVVAGIPKPANQFSVVPRAVIQMAVGAGFALGALWAQPPVAMAQDPARDAPKIQPNNQFITFEMLLSSLAILGGSLSIYIWILLKDKTSKYKENVTPVNSYSLAKKKEHEENIKCYQNMIDRLLRNDTESLLTDDERKKLLAMKDELGGVSLDQKEILNDYSHLLNEFKPYINAKKFIKNNAITQIINEIKESTDINNVIENSNDKENLSKKISEWLLLAQKIQESSEPLMTRSFNFDSRENDWQKAFSIFSILETIQEFFKKLHENNSAIMTYQRMVIEKFYSGEAITELTGENLKNKIAEQRRRAKIHERCDELLEDWNIRHPNETFNTNTQLYLFLVYLKHYDLSNQNFFSIINAVEQLKNNDNEFDWEKINRLDWKDIKSDFHSYLHDHERYADLMRSMLSSSRLNILPKN